MCAGADLGCHRSLIAHVLPHMASSAARWSAQSDYKIHRLTLTPEQTGACLPLQIIIAALKWHWMSFYTFHGMDEHLHGRTERK